MSGNSSQTDLTERFIEISLSLIRIERKLRATASGSSRPADSQPPYIIHIIASAAYGRDHNLLSPHFVDGPFRLRITCPGPASAFLSATDARRGTAVIVIRLPEGRERSGGGSSELSHWKTSRLRKAIR